LKQVFPEGEEEKTTANTSKIASNEGVQEKSIKQTSE